jgi:hypothetical protein
MDLGPLFVAVSWLGLASAVVAEDLHTVPPSYVLATEGEEGAFFVHVDSIVADGAVLEA